MSLQDMQLEVVVFESQYVQRIKTDQRINNKYVRNNQQCANNQQDDKYLQNNQQAFNMCKTKKTQQKRMNNLELLVNTLLETLN